MPGLQEWIHKLEEGGGPRFIRIIAAILGLIALAVTYNFREFKGFSTLEAMDSAQVARKISTGQGFTTDFVRPLSMHLIESYHQDTRIRESHPDLANPPLYPLLLAGLLKVTPVRYEITELEGEFRRYQPEVVIAWFNQTLLVLVILLVFWLARRLFDPTIAWIAAATCAGTNLFWRFSGSGLPMILLMLIFLSLCTVLVAIQDASRDQKRGRTFLLSLSLLAGLLVGAGGLTSYGFACLILPVLAFLWFSLGPHRILGTTAALAAFVALLLPWLFRNYSLSGTLFGTAGYALLQGTSRFSDNRLERSLNLDLSLNPVAPSEIVRKLMINLADLCENDLPRSGSNWIIAFFLVGLFIPFQRPALGRLRRFVAGSALTLLVVQALGKTHLSTDSPVINSENYLVIVTPLLFIFGASMFSLLLDQVTNLVWRNLLVVTVIAIFSAPLIFQLLPPRAIPFAYPPYYPPVIQMTAHFMRDGEAMMSDMPWAVAWYGNRQCLWLTLNADHEFFDINDFQKPMQGLYLTSITLDSRFYSQMLRDNPLGFRKMVDEGAKTWEGLALVSLAREEVPTGFPFKFAAPRFLKDQLFLTDRVRWRKLGQ